MSIAIFNQASKVTVYPLVSITTSFVAEEETVARTAAKLQEDEKPEKCSEKDNGLKPEDEMLENLENGDPSTGKGGGSYHLSLQLSVSHHGREMYVINLFDRICFLDLPDLNATARKSSPLFCGKVNKAKSTKGKRHIPSASTSLMIGGVLGLLQTLFLIFGAKSLLGLMGVKSVSDPSNYLVLALGMINAFLKSMLET